jgi:hypothetical protein
VADFDLPPLWRWAGIAAIVMVGDDALNTEEGVSIGQALIPPQVSRTIRCDLCSWALTRGLPPDWNMKVTSAPWLLTVERAKRWRSVHHIKITPDASAHGVGWVRMRSTAGSAPAGRQVRADNIMIENACAAAVLVIPRRCSIQVPGMNKCGGSDDLSSAQDKKSLQNPVTNRRKSVSNRARINITMSDPIYEKM